MTGKDNLSQRASKGVFWNLISGMGVSMVGFTGTAFLARILSPREFGLIGMAVLVTGVINLFGNLGFTGALIHQRQTTEEQHSTVFWFNLGLSFFLLLACNLLAPLTAYFFEEPIVRWILVGLSINFVITALSSIHVFFIFRDLQFKKLAFVEISGVVCRVAIALSMAFSGYGVWSIVGGMIGERIAKAILFFQVIKWRPRLLFHKAKLLELFHFGKNLFGSGLLNYFEKNFDYIVVGKFLGSSALGYYRFAYFLPHLAIYHVAEKFRDVVFPIYSKIQDDQARVTRGFLLTATMLSTVIYPMMLGLFFVADDFVLTLYGNKWLPSIAPLQILCISSAILAVSIIDLSLIYSQGKPEIVFRWMIITSILTVILTILGSYGGIVGVALAMTVVSCLSLFLTRMCIKILNARMRSYFRAIKPAFISASFMIIVLFVVKELLGGKTLSPPVALAYSIPLGALAYIAFYWKFYRREFHTFFSLLESVRNKNA